MDVDKSDEQFVDDALFSVIIGTALVTVLGGLLWGYVVMLTGSELGFVAWALGGLAGVGVVMFSKGKRARRHQVIAVLASILGITIGKYIFFYDTVNKLFKEAYGAEAASDVSIFSVDLVRVFFENPSKTLGGLNMLWMALALVTAWSIPRSGRLHMRK